MSAPRQMHESTHVAKRSITRIVLPIGLVLALGAFAFAIYVPRLVKARIIAAAAAHGVALTIGDLAIAPGHARLKNVTATALIRSDATAAPKASATAALVDVTLDWTTPTAVDVTGMHVALEADAGDLRTALASRNAPGGSAATITRVTLHDASLEWKRAVPIDAIVIGADHVNGDVTKKGNRALGEDYHFEANDIRATPKKDLAAWSGSVDASDQGLRIEIARAQVAKIKFAELANGAHEINVDTQNVGVSDLGLPAEALGLHGDETSRFEIHLHHEQKNDQAQGTFVASASDVFLGTSTARTSLAVDMRYAGDPKTSMKITAGTLRAGPFTGAIEGGFQLGDAGFKASLRYTSGVMACVDAVKSQIASSGAVGQGVAALAGMLGLDKVVEGRVSLHGEIEVDTQTSTNRFSFRTQGDCKLSYLPAGL